MHPHTPTIESAFGHFLPLCRGIAPVSAEDLEIPGELWAMTDHTVGDLLDDHDVWVLLAEAVGLIAAAGGTIEAVPEAGSLVVDLDDLPEWAMLALERHFDLLVVVWRKSPAAIIVCEVCGEPMLVSTRSRAGRRCIRSNCAGKMRALEVPWKSNRPRGRTGPLTTERRP